MKSIFEKIKNSEQIDHAIKNINKKGVEAVIKEARANGYLKK